ncbi:hypothetical protein N0V95_003227 [Ascochyta clinopodiicola]|nr:hypothetical protein N0V95_003227 [Ascochyta clinopodiicola]
MDYVDLYLMHWPSAFKSGPDLIPVGEGKLLVEEIDYVETYKAMEELLLTGKTKAIGISNFSQHELVRLLENTAVVPAVHQLELHPWLQQKDFVEYNRSKGIHVTHYSPLGNQNGAYNNSSSDYGKLIDDPVLMDIGKKHGKSSAQVALAWGITLGHSVIPKSKTLSRIKENLESDFSLDEEDLGRIERLDKKLRFNDPSDTFDYNYFADLDGKR